MDPPRWKKESDTATEAAVFTDFSCTALALLKPEAIRSGTARSPSAAIAVSNRTVDEAPVSWNPR